MCKHLSFLSCVSEGVGTLLLKEQKATTTMAMSAAVAQLGQEGQDRPPVYQQQTFVIEGPLQLQANQGIRMGIEPSMSNSTVVVLRDSSFTTSKRSQTVISMDVFPEVRQPLFLPLYLENLKSSGKSSLQRQVGEETKGILTFKVTSCLYRIKEVG